MTLQIIYWVKIGIKPEGKNKAKSRGVPIKSVFIYNHNPVAVHPDQNKMIKALSQKDVFVIGCDITMTDSMKYADVILPACSSFEHNDVYLGYGHNYAQRAEPVISASRRRFTEHRDI